MARSNPNLDVTQAASASIDYSSLKSGQKKALEPQLRGFPVTFT